MTLLPAFQYLALSFSLDIADDEMRALLGDLFADCGSTATPNAMFAVLENSNGRLSVCVDGLPVRTTTDPAHAVAHLLWEINRRALATPSDALILHAAAVERGGGAVVCSAPSGSGKSTLAAGLVAAGFAYLADDAVALDLERGYLLPALKPIALRRDAERAIAALSPPTPARAVFAGDERFVSWRELGGAAGTASPMRLVVLPRFVPGAPLSVVDITRAEALVVLAEQSFNFHTHGEVALRGLAAALRACVCVRLEYGRLEDTVAVVGELLAAAAGERAPERAAPV